MTHPRPIRLSMTALLGVVAALAVVILQGGAGRATHSSSTVELVAVDPAIDGNAPTVVGPIDSCFQVAPGTTVDIDVIVNAIPADRPLTAFQFDLFYSPGIVNVVAFNSSMLLAAQPGSNVLPPLTDPVPDSDGEFQAAALDFGTSTETGPGVLSRITLQAVGTGVTPLSPSTEEVLIYDDRNERVTVNSIGAAYLAIGEACPADQPTPLAAVPGATPNTEDGEPEAKETPAGSTPAPATANEGSATPEASGDGSVGGEDLDSNTRNNSGSDGGNNGDSFPVWLIVLLAVIAGAAALAGGAYLYRRRLS